MAVWKPAFTEFMHETLTQTNAGRSPGESFGGREMFVGHVVQRFIDQGRKVVATRLSDMPGIDAGTVDGLASLKLRLPAIMRNI